MMLLLAKRIKEMEIDISSDYKREQETEGMLVITPLPTRHSLTHSLTHSSLTLSYHRTSKKT